MVNFKKGIQVADILPEDTIMVGEAMPLTTDEFETNNKISEFLKGKEYLKKMLVKKICGS